VFGSFDGFYGLRLGIPFRAFCLFTGVCGGMLLQGDLFVGEFSYVSSLPLPSPFLLNNIILPFY
jgi:hypothetical protein